MLCPKHCGFSGLRTELATHLDEVHNLLLCTSLKCSQTFSGKNRKCSLDEHFRTKHLNQGYRCSVCGKWKRYKNYIYKHGCVNAKPIRDTQEHTSSDDDSDSDDEKPIPSQSKKLKLQKRPSQTETRKIVTEDDSSSLLTSLSSSPSSSSSTSVSKTIEMLRRHHYKHERERSLEDLSQCIQDAIRARLNNLDNASIKNFFDPTNVEDLARCIYDGIKSKYRFNTQCNEEALQWIIHAIKIFNIRSKITTTYDDIQPQKSSKSPTTVESNAASANESTHEVDKCVGTSDDPEQWESSNYNAKSDVMVEMRNEIHRQNKRLANAETKSMLAMRTSNALKMMLVAKGIISNDCEHLIQVGVDLPLPEHDDSLPILADELVEDDSSSDQSSKGKFYNWCRN